MLFLARAHPEVTRTSETAPRTSEVRDRPQEGSTWLHIPGSADVSTGLARVVFRWHSGVHGSFACRSSKASCPLRVRGCSTSLGRGRVGCMPGGPAGSGLGGELGRAMPLSPGPRACLLFPARSLPRGLSHTHSFGSSVGTTCTSDPYQAFTVTAAALAASGQRSERGGGWRV